ncbi:hypothetical protein K469DRAFT_567803, partial [Zopfia rhizophila CBS 207.26]
DWGKCGITWTMVSSANPNKESSWRSTDHFSMLPYGWIPEDGVDFFTQFILHLKDRWLKLCNLAEEHLTDCRLDQLHEKGEGRELIPRLAEDAREWTNLRRILKDQVNTAGNFAVDYCYRYNENKGLEDLKGVIDGFADTVSDRISQLDQTVRDLLQFEFAWVSINEAHKSTSLATSMKRLSWVTFVFLPAMFASSIFSMNVDIFKNDPDWRWYLLFGGVSLIFTMCGWLIFKCCPVRDSPLTVCYFFMVLISDTD